MLNAKNVVLKMRVIDRGFANRDPVTGESLRYYAIQDPHGVLKDEIELKCTPAQLEKKLESIQVQLEATYGRGYVHTPNQQYAANVRANQGRAVGPGWSCRQAGEQALRTVGVPPALAALGGFGLDLFLGVKMHESHTTTGKEMREGFEDVFSWRK